jgi:serine phosphatase RsbU (regulator of sigma subunit)
MIYAFTDGLTDQIGGPQGRKLGPKRLREFFLSIALMPLSEQLLALQAFLRDWQGEYPQTDDMTCLGLRLG